jgi:hypothetical protein
MLENLRFDTRPLVVHAPGPPVFNPYWEPVCERFFATRRRALGPPARLTLLTWNDGANGPGILERSLAHLGVPCAVAGRGVRGWMNSVHKPLAARQALRSIETEYVLGVDSSDAILLGDPAELVARFEASFAPSGAEMVFAAEKNNAPNAPRFRRFEEALPGAADTPFRFLNGGTWLGRTETCRAFFADAVRTPPAPEDPASEQGILKQLFLTRHPSVALDYRCELFQTLLLVSEPILAWDGLTLSHARRRGGDGARAQSAG